MRPVLNIIRRLAGRYAVLIFAASFLLGLFQFLITAVVSTFDVPAMLAGVIAFLPANVRTAMDLIFGGLSPKGLIGFGWDHPIAHTAGTVVAVVLGARAVAGEIEDGTLELVLSQPISRVTYMLANVAFAIMAIATVCAAGVFGSSIGQRVFEQQTATLGELARVAINLGLVLLALYAITLLASSLTREGGRALGIGALIAIVSFMLRVVALLWRDIAFLEPYSVHSYYAPRTTLEVGRIPAGSLMVLLPLILLTLLLAFHRFERRDIP